MKFGHDHADGVAAGQPVVDVAGAFVDVVIDVGAHDHPVVPRQHRGQFGAQGAGVFVPRRQIPVDGTQLAWPIGIGFILHPTDELVAQVPDGVVGEVQRVGPVALGVFRIIHIFDRVGHSHRPGRIRLGRDRNFLYRQVCGRTCDDVHNPPLVIHVGGE